MWTLIYNGVEKSLADWGVSDDWSRERDNKSRGTVSLRTVEDFDDGATQWVADSQAQIWRDRDSIGVGGTLWAQGYFDDPERSIIGGKRHITYRLHNVWWLLEQHPFQQPRTVVTSISGSPPVVNLDQVFLPEVFLGEGLQKIGPTSYQIVQQTNGQQVTEILNWVNECFNATKRGATVGRDDAQDILAIGTIEPRQNIGIKRAAVMLCSEAIIDVLRFQPDTIVYIDETQTPPKVNVRTIAKWNYETSPPTFVDYSNLPERRIIISAEQETQIQVQAQTWKQLPGVAIFWWGTNTIDGVPYPFSWVDKFPADVSLYTPRLAVHFMELQGSQVTTETAEVQVEALANLLSADQAGQVAWWREHDQTLNDPKVDTSSIVVGAPSVVDMAGNPINTSAYPNILKDSSLPRWAAGLTPPVTWQRAVIRAEVKFTRYADAAKKIVDTKASTRVINKTVKVTNAVTKTYRAVKEVTGGETMPAGIAESVFRSSNMLQHGGTVEFSQKQLRADIDFGYRYTLVGPNTSFPNMLPQRIVERPCFGVTTVTFGPAPLASVDYLLELLRATRFRTTYRMPSGRADGGNAGGTDVNTGSDTPSEDTAHSPGGHQVDSVTFKHS
jgi:hypothetical protein